MRQIMPLSSGMTTQTAAKLGRRHVEGLAAAEAAARSETDGTELLQSRKEEKRKG